VQIAVEFPLAPHRLGDTAVVDLARAIEDLGYDEIDLLEHVTVALPAPGRTLTGEAAPDLLEPLVTLGAIAAVTRRIGLGTEILILPQRPPALVAKQVATLDVLSGGRVRLGVGAGWQEPEFDSLGVPFAERGRRLEEGIRLIRRYWTESSVTFQGAFYHAEAMAMDRKPVQPGGPPIWLGGDSEVALRRVGRLGDGWMAMADSQDAVSALPRRIATIRAAAEEAGRDPAAIGVQMRIDPVDDLDGLARRIDRYRDMGVTWIGVSLPAIEAAGAHDVDAQVDALARIMTRVRSEEGVTTT